jgi:DNA replication protein DnaC
MYEIQGDRPVMPSWVQTISPFSRAPYVDVTLKDERIPESIREFLAHQLVNEGDIVLCGPDNRHSRSLAAAAFVNEFILRYTAVAEVSTAWMKMDYIPNLLTELRAEHRWDEYHATMKRMERSTLLFIQDMEEFEELAPDERRLVRRIFSSRETYNLRTIITMDTYKTLYEYVGHTLQSRIMSRVGENYCIWSLNAV